MMNNLSQAHLLYTNIANLFKIIYKSNHKYSNIRKHLKFH